MFETPIVPDTGFFDELRTYMHNAMIIMTCHGTIVCGDGSDGLVHVALDTLGRGDDPLVFDLDYLTRAGRHERMLTKANLPLTLEGLPGLPNGCVMEVSGDRRTAHLRRGERLFSAEPGRRDIPSDRTLPGLWETFLFITEQDFAGIRHVFLNSWVIGSTLKIVEADQISFREGFLLSFGDLAVDLRYNLPLLGHGCGRQSETGRPDAINLTIDGWKIDRIYRYRPLIFFTAFGSPYVIDQACTAIASLIEFGGYDGDFHIITDQNKRLFLESVPGLLEHRLSVQEIGSHDWVGFVAAKYAILDYPAAYEFQPLLFLDTDVVCDAPVQPLLATIVALERMSAPLEEMTSLQTNPSVGATLIQKSGYEPRLGCGVNGGTIGIPNLASCAETLQLVRTIITNHIDLFGRDQFRWVDQEVLNYVSYRVGHFDSSALLRYVRYGWENAEFDATRRLGLVHFWPGIPHRPKQDRMHDYVATLRNADRGP